MTRTIIPYPQELDTATIDPYPGMERRTYDIEVITPIFGGGVEAGRIDPEHPIRESSIRGHLRFWWRATRGAQFTDVRELLQREGEIWGSTENPSPVEIEIKTTFDKVSPCGRYEFNQQKRRGQGGYDLYWWNNQKSEDNPAFLYTLFPFQGKSKDSKEPCDPSDTIISLKFSLIIKFPTEDKMSGLRPIYNELREKENKRISKENEKRHDANKEPLDFLPLIEERHDDIAHDIDAAVWGWINFGGVGARTRRGCGALSCIDYNPPLKEGKSLTPPDADVNSLNKWYSSCLDLFNLKPLEPEMTRQWPTIPQGFFVKVPTAGDENTDSVNCWYDSLALLQKFRQGADIGRDPGRNPKKPSRSRWPEAETLRTAVYGSGTRPYGIHPPDPRMANNIPAFPRVEFGMPIILEIRQEKIKPTLQPGEESDRMASPLILRPLGYGKGDTVSCMSMIMRLITPRLSAAYVKPGKPHEDNTNSPDITSLEITKSEIYSSACTAYTDSPMANRCTNGSALDAFIAFAQEPGQGFRKVR